MNLRIKSLHLYSFKGVTEAHYDFTDNTLISGQNGSGKTTIATAWYWLTTDRDYDLVANPNIRPLFVEESTPRVEVVIDIDGKEINLAKQQKKTVSKPNAEGISKVSLTNSYEINSVPKSERDFKGYLEECGIDFNNFFALSHPEVFMGWKANDMRKVLFAMASEKTDKEIAMVTTGAEKVSQLLDNYTLDEIKAMQSATLKKIKDDYGKDGELIRKQIEGLEKAKSDVDLTELTNSRDDIRNRIEMAKTKRNNISAQLKEMNELEVAMLDAKHHMQGIEYKANEKLINDKNQLKYSVDMAMRTIDSCNSNISFKQKEIDRLNTELANANQEREKALVQWKSVKSETFDESKLICPTCKQSVPETMKNDLINGFEDNKKSRLSQIEKNGFEIKEKINNISKNIEDLKADIVSILDDRQAQEELVKGLNRQLSELPEKVDVSTDEQYIAYKKTVDELSTKIDRSFSTQDHFLDEEIFELSKQLSAVERQLGKADNNEDIKQKIAELLNKQTEYEQAKADAECILEQIDLVSRNKNSMLSDEINRHFELVNFKLFEYQKNGNYAECCIAQTKEGKDMNVSTNTGLTVAMKLDIIKGLQKFYGQYYPVFLDGAECLSDNSLTLINMDCQMIYLKVTKHNRLLVDAQHNNLAETIPQYNIDKKVEGC